MADENRPQEMEDQPQQDESQAQESQTEPTPAAEDDVKGYGEPIDGSGGGKP
jgi:hypothetical protein